MATTTYNYSFDAYSTYTGVDTSGTTIDNYFMYTSAITIPNLDEDITSFNLSLSFYSYDASSSIIGSDSYDSARMVVSSYIGNGKTISNYLLINSNQSTGCTYLNSYKGQAIRLQLPIRTGEYDVEGKPIWDYYNSNYSGTFDHIEAVGTLTLVYGKDVVNINFGGNALKDIYWGNNKITTMYNGDKKIF